MNLKSLVATRRFFHQTVYATATGVRVGLVAALLGATGLAQAAAPVSFSYSGTPVAIPDGSGFSGAGAEVGAPITVSGLSGTVAHVAMSIDGTACTATAGANTVGLSHSWVGDLVIRLQSPTGVVVTAVSRLGASPNSVGHSANNFCQLTLDDASPGASVQTAPNAGPVTGSYQPANPFAGFVGQAPNGTWTLLAQDFSELDTGSIRAWTVTITPTVDATTTTLASSLNPSTVGQPVTFTATVASAGATPTGAVDFLDGAAPLCSAVVPAAGVATCTTSVLSVGTHSLTAVYAGDASTVTSTSAALTQTVNQAASTTTLSITPLAPLVGQPVTLTASIAGNAPGGTVTFNDGAAPVCSAVAVTTTGNTAAASCTTPPLTSGTHSFVAQYSGDVNNAVSANAPLVVALATAAVNPVPTLSPALLLALAGLVGVAAVWRRRAG